MTIFLTPCDDYAIIPQHLSESVRNMPCRKIKKLVAHVKIIIDDRDIM